MTRVASLALCLILSHSQRQATGRAGLFNSCEAPGASEMISAEAQDAAWSTGKEQDSAALQAPCSIALPMRLCQSERLKESIAPDRVTGTAAHPLRFGVVCQLKTVFPGCNGSQEADLSCKVSGRTFLRTQARRKQRGGGQQGEFICSIRKVSILRGCAVSLVALQQGSSL